MSCERARVHKYVWARDPGEKRVLSKQESYSSVDGSDYIRPCFGKPLKARQCRGHRLSYPLFGKAFCHSSGSSSMINGAWCAISLWGLVTE